MLDRACLGNALQPGQGLLWAALQLPAEKVFEQPPPPPGRKDEVSAELDPRPAICKGSQRHVLLIENSKW